MHASITHSAYVPRSLINHLDTHTVVVVITPGVDLYGAQHALQRSPPHNGHMPHSVRAAGSTSTGARTALSVHTCARWPACDSAVAGVTACWATPHSVQHVASIRGAPLIPSAVCCRRLSRDGPPMRSTRPASGDPSPCHAPRESHGGSDENETRKRRAGGPQNCGRQDAQNLHLPTNFSYERHRVTEEHAKRTYYQKSGSSTSVPAPRGS